MSRQIATEEPWWADDPGVVPCPQCGCPTQNGPTGMRAHFDYVHAGRHS